MIRSASFITSGSKEVWANQNLPLPTRVRKTFTLGLEKALVDWNSPKPEIHFDDEANFLDIGPVRILNLTVNGPWLQCDWQGA